MDVPAKFTSVDPSWPLIVQYFKWDKHPALPELEFYCSHNISELKPLLIQNKQSWQWPYLWESGVALARWILDLYHEPFIKDRLVFDIGTGQGAALIAAKKRGAKIAVGVDCCVFSELVLACNSERNKVTTVSYTKDLFKATIPDGSLILASDLIYGQPTSKDLMDKLVDLSQTSDVVIAQATGRRNPKFEINDDNFYKFAQYSIPTFTPKLELDPEMEVTLYSVGKPLELK
jgi:predicted nicotinamide N-methyase